jgi:hypothetical protein
VVGELRLHNSARCRMRAPSSYCIIGTSLTPFIQKT